LSAVQVSTQGFGTGLILSQETPSGFTTPRTYASLAGVAVDFPAATAPATYNMANAYFSQTPSPPLLMVAKQTGVTTQVFTISFPTIANSTVYSGEVDGQAWTYTSGGSATQSAICTAIASAINALTAVNGGVTAATSGSGSSEVVTVTSTVAGKWHTAGIDSLTLMGLAQTNGGSATSNLTTDLNTALTQQGQNFYTVLYPFGSAADIAAIASWAQSASPPKTYIAQTQDSACVTVTPGSDSSSIMYTLKNASYSRTMCIYKKSTSDFADAAWAGSKLPATPGSETWCFAQLQGVPADTFTETQRNNVVGTIGNSVAGKYGNIYETVAGVNVTEIGITSSGEFFDNVRFIDWLNANIQSTILQALFAASESNTKIPFTTAGISMIGALILGVLKQGVSNGGFSNLPAPAVQVPLIGNVSSTNLNARNLPNVGYTGTLAGAIQSVQIAGTVVA
jgi:hypothetical protein